MYPPALASWLSSPQDIDIDGNDEDMVMHLRRMINGHPPPDNVLTGVNPYIVAPWNLPENMLYFFDPKDYVSLKDGYWKPTGQDHAILENSPGEGRRTTLEFYKGQDPYGVKTDWVMHAYAMIQRAQNSSFLLCRVFHNVVGIFNHEAHDEVNWQDIGGEILENLPNDQDNNHNSPDPTNAPQVANGREDGPVQDFERNLQNMRPYFPNQVPDEAIGYMLSGGFLELNDLMDSPFSSSENTSDPSLNSDDYFDSEALLRDLESTDNNNIMEQGDVNHNLNVAASHAPSQLFFTPPPLGTLSNDSNNLQRKEDTVSAPVPGNVAEKKDDGKAMKRVSSWPELSLRPSTSRGIARRARSDGSGSSRIAKIGKKYCCFMSF